LNADGGTDSATGSRFVERILSVVATCRQEGRNVWDYLSDCHRAGLADHRTPPLLPVNPAGRLVA
jgi:transposase